MYSSFICQIDLVARPLPIDRILWDPGDTAYSLLYTLQYGYGRGRVARADSGSAVTASPKVIGSSTGRLSHHRMVSGDVRDGLGLVIRSRKGR